MREWGVEAITYLVKAALQYKYEKPLKDNLVNMICQSTLSTISRLTIFLFKTDITNITVESAC